MAMAQTTPDPSSALPSEATASEAAVAEATAAGATAPDTMSADLMDQADVKDQLEDQGYSDVSLELETAAIRALRPPTARKLTWKSMARMAVSRLSER